jgi:hypothetical protein
MMVSLRSTINIPTRDNDAIAEIVYGEMGQQTFPVECHRNEEKLSRSFIGKKFLALKPRLPKSLARKRIEAQPTKHQPSDTSPLSGGGPHKRKPPRSVQFMTEPVVYMYDANPDLEQNIWWYSEELDALRKDSIAEESDTIKEYLIAYKRSFREIQSIDKVSSQNMAELVAGMDRGHRGLEIFTSLQQVERKSETGAVIASVVALYKRHKQSNGGESTDKLLRAHSKALTARSRHWAQTLGQADMYASDSTDTTHLETDSCQPSNHF